MMGTRVSERLKERYHNISPGLPLNNIVGGHHVFDGGDKGNPSLVCPFHIPEGDWTSHAVSEESSK